MTHFILLSVLSLLSLTSVAPEVKITVTGTVTCKRSDDFIGDDGIHCVPQYSNEFLIEETLKGDEPFSDRYDLVWSGSHNCTANNQKLSFKSKTKFLNITETAPQTYKFHLTLDDLGEPVDNYMKK